MTSLVEEMELFLADAVAYQRASRRMLSRYRRDLLKWLTQLAEASGAASVMALDAAAITSGAISAILEQSGWATLRREERETTLAPLELFCRWLVDRQRLATNPFVGLRTGARRRSQAQRLLPDPGL